MTTNLLYIGKSKSFLTQFGKLEDVQLIYAKDHKDAITICINLKARENIIILYEQGNLKEDVENITLFRKKLRDVYFNIQHLRRPELNVRGMVFAFQTDTAHKVGFRTDIIRGEDGSLALGLKKYGKIKFVRSRKARAVTGYGTISADGSLFNSFWKRTVKGINNFTSLFHYKEKYEDEDSNLIK